MIIDFETKQICSHLDCTRDENGTLQATSNQDNCSACNGRELLYDYQFNSEGNPRFLTGADQKPREDIARLIITQKGQNVFVPNYGLDTNKYIGRKISTTINSRIKKDIFDSASFLLRLQQHPTYFSYLTSAQTIQSIQAADIAGDQPTAILVSVRFGLQNGVSSSTAALLSKE